MSKDELRPTVTQADRDLFVAILNPDASTAESVKRGRSYTWEVEQIAKHRAEAADRIEALEAENERLRKALELIRDPDNVYYATEMRAFARAALGEKQ